MFNIKKILYLKDVDNVFNVVIVYKIAVFIS